MTGDQVFSSIQHQEQILGMLSLFFTLQRKKDWKSLLTSLDLGRANSGTNIWNASKSSTEKKYICYLLFFYKKIFENFTHIYAHKKYLGHICSWLLTPRVLLEIHFPSKFMSSIFYNPLNPISTAHMHMDVVSPTEAYAILQWTMSPNKNDSPHPLADTSCE